MSVTRWSRMLTGVVCVFLALLFCAPIVAIGLLTHSLVCDDGVPQTDFVTSTIKIFGHELSGWQMWGVLWVFVAIGIVFAWVGICAFKTRDHAL